MKRYSVDWETCGSGTPRDELERLQYYCETFGGDASLAIEIGSHQGASAALLAEWFDVVICVDPWGYEEPLSPGFMASFAHSPGSNESFPIYMANMCRLGIWDERVIPIVGTSKALERFPYLGADLVFVDDGHNYPSCSQDIRISLPHLKPNGLLVCHDYDRGEFIPDPYIGVKQAVDEAIEKYNLEVIEHFRGIVALKRRSI